MKTLGRLECLLHRRVQSCKDKFSNIDEIVSYLCSNYPRDYCRIKQQSLARMVSKALDSSRSTKRKGFQSTEKSQADAEEDLSGSSLNVKKTKKDSLETPHLSSNKLINQDKKSTNSSVERHGDDSMSEDANYEQEKLEPEYDLIKSMLRANYSISKTAGEGKNTSKENINKADDLNTKSKRMADAIPSGGVRSGKVKVLSSSSKDDDITGITEKPTRFEDLGGMEEVFDKLNDATKGLRCPQLLRKLGAKPITGILFHGPPGCGKTKLAEAIANEVGVPFYKISATEVSAGASEEFIRELFMKAHRSAPSIVFIDEIDVIASKRQDLQREVDQRIVIELMTWMDQSHSPIKSSTGYVLVIGATNRPDVIDTALRRPGRFDYEIALGVPNENARREIVSVLTRNKPLDGSVDLGKIASNTYGFVGADLEALVNKAAYLAIDNFFQRKLDNGNKWWQQSCSIEEEEKFFITMTDFENALKMIQPSTKREGFSQIPNIKWEDIGGLDSLRKDFDETIVRRIRDGEAYEKLVGFKLEAGFLLYGPPGCGKTLIAQAIANEAGANYIYIKGPELLNKFVGESERAVRTLFSRAKTCAPCIIFFDELLLELSDHQRGVFVIGATNRIETIDKAFLRPGRFEKIHYVGLPSQEERASILKAISRKMPLDPDVDLNSIAQMKACDNLSGADLGRLIKEAAILALRDWNDLKEKLHEASGVPPFTVKTTHFQCAMSKISPSVSQEDIEHYNKTAKKYNAQ
ncbi:hypothetical protein SAY87_031140 [Trapa incisa]|uniref:AAA+ ATPase domain-containing protein n=1 Tax=Trapa incisa TaxID=236973 RepID=A0AAN7KK28_9MYRT|nr:hypothetical protein SAY87_031140 [Trapa incisa]